MHLWVSLALNTCSNSIGICTSPATACKVNIIKVLVIASARPHRLPFETCPLLLRNDGQSEGHDETADTPYADQP